MTAKKYAPETKAKAKELHAQGMSYWEVAKALGIPDSTAHYWVHDGVWRKPRKPSVARYVMRKDSNHIEAVRKLAAEGRMRMEIAEIAGLTRATVNRICEENGISTRATKRSSRKNAYEQRDAGLAFHQIEDREQQIAAIYRRQREGAREALKALQRSAAREVAP